MKMVFHSDFLVWQSNQNGLDQVHSTLQVKTILVAMATKILEVATKLEPKSPAWRLKLRRRIESVSLIY